MTSKPKKTIKIIKTEEPVEEVLIVKEKPIKKEEKEIVIKYIFGRKIVSTTFENNYFVLKDEVGTVYKMPKAEYEAL